MKKPAKILSLALSLLLLVSLLAACTATPSPTPSGTASAAPSPSASAPAATDAASPSPSADNTYAENGLPKDQKVTLTVGFWLNAAGQAWYDDCVTAFEQQFPNVTINTTYSPTISDTVKTKLQSNDDAGMFNIFYYGDWKQVYTAGKAAPLTDLLDRTLYDKPGTKLRDSWIPGVMDDLSYSPSGDLYYMPISTYIGGMFYDQALFAQKGWNTSPNTWAEFTALLQQIKASGMTPIGAGGTVGYERFAFGPKQFELAAINGTFTQYLSNFKNKVIPYYSTPENIERWSRESQLGKDGYIDPNSVSMNHTQSQMALLQHQVAMIPDGDWVAQEMKDSTPADFKWGFMGVPYTTDASQTIYLADGINNYFMVYSAKPALEVQWSKEFLLFLNNMACQQNLAEKGGSMPIRADYASDPTRLANLPVIEQSILQYMTQHKTALVDSLAGGGSNVILTDPSDGQALKLITDNSPLMTVGQVDPTPILQQADQLQKVAVDAYNASNPSSPIPSSTSGG